MNVFSYASLRGLSKICIASLLWSVTNGSSCAIAEGLSPTQLRIEWLTQPKGVDSSHPRMSWRLESERRGDGQTAYQILVATRVELLSPGNADLWDTGKITSNESLNIAYNGESLASRQEAFWTLRVWDRADTPSRWTSPQRWTMGLLTPDDWQARWISFHDTSALHRDRATLFLPPARHYRKTIATNKSIRRATVYASALGIYELHVNGQRVGDAYFEPGWADYAKRAYYRVHDITDLIHEGKNCVGAIVADGWYSGYIGYGLLVGYGPNKVGRYFYGKTPALLAQIEIEYTDGTRSVIGTDSTWEVSGDGPVREADFLMGETFDARRDRSDWCAPDGASAWNWDRAIDADENGHSTVVFSDNRGDRSIDLGFRAPATMKSYMAPAIRVTEELPAIAISEPAPGVYVFDLGQNFAGFVRLKVKGESGTEIRLRFGEMLHSDGRLMTENLRRARATDSYILRGDADGETWTPRFTYHGFQYVELTGLQQPPALDAVTGLVLHNDTQLTGTFQCSDALMTQFWKNTLWTQRANFIEIPTDCPQRDERLGWMGDAQVYVRTASFNADVAAFFNKWLDDVEEAQLSFGAYPDYAPYPMGHGAVGKNFGTAWTDAGIICPWTIWHVYGDERVIHRHWDSMTRFMQWRIATSRSGLGTSLGNTWGDWLNAGEETELDYIDTAYFAHDQALMAEMADALGKTSEAANYRRLHNQIKAAFAKAYLKSDSAITVDTQTAYALAIAFDLLPTDQIHAAGRRLADKIAENGNRMATGFLGTKHLLPALTRAGQHDLAVRLFQSRKYPSWGYEVVNGANTVWERWDSYTKEHGFDGATGSNNAAMNSFSHYSFGAVMEWAFRDLAGIDTEGPSYHHVRIRPTPPQPGSNPDVKPIHWVKAQYNGPRGLISSDWSRSEDAFSLNVSIPANTTATVYMPASSSDFVTENGRPIATVEDVKFLRMESGYAVFEIDSGRYVLKSSSPNGIER